MGLTQKEAGSQLGVTESAIWNWENGWSSSQFRFFLRITQFLGYEIPIPEPVTLGQTIKRCRFLQGISQKELARLLGLDPTTLARSEKGESRQSTRLMQRLYQFPKSFFISSWAKAEKTRLSARIRLELFEIDWLWTQLNSHHAGSLQHSAAAGDLSP